MGRGGRVVWVGEWGGVGEWCGWESGEGERVVRVGEWGGWESGEGGREGGYM